MFQDYKKTLLMPQTHFPMKGNLSQKEIKIQKFWENINLYEKNLKKNKNNKHFFLHDGPPYANGNIHIGHALNKILKDFIIRFKTMQNYYTPYIPGWDTHGLPIEIAVFKKYSKESLVNKKIFLQKCKEFALKFIEKQKQDFKRLGILGEWEKPYLTLNKSFIADEIRIFSQMIEKKLIFKNLKPIYWSPFLQSALSESEIEYQNYQSLSIFITYQIIENSNPYFQNSKLLVWTTTPWTLPANVAVCLHPEKNYHLIKVNQKKYIIGENVFTKLKEKFFWKEVQILQTFKGKILENFIYQDLMFSKKGKIVLDTFVSDIEGTGLVHIAPGHGIDDFLLSQKYNLNILCSIDKKGYMTDIAGPYKGFFFQKANNLIIQGLENKKLLIKKDFFIHQYPHDSRIKKPVVFLAVSQWFLNINQIKKKLSQEIQKIKWFPEWGKIKMENMIKDRKDWVISRQRTWGVPIPIFYTEDNKPILDAKLTEHISNLFEKHGEQIWFEWDIKDLLPPNYKNHRNIFSKEQDILDVWFDSGTSFNIIKRKNNKFFPSDVYLEGNDQYRGWFNSSLITSVAVFNKTPYKKIITHGFVLDGLGQKMSKSLNNVIDPLNIIEQKGADILRLWVASINYNIDVKIDENILKQVEEKYRKIRNTFRFMLGNLNNFNPKSNHYISFQNRKPLHQVIILEFKKILIQIIKYYKDYNFEKIMSLLYPFISNRISAFYLDFTKDILYIEKEDNFERRIIQSNIYDLLIDFLKILTPIIPHTTSEAYEALQFKSQEDIYLENIPTTKELKSFINQLNQELLHKEKAFALFNHLREIILKHLEEARQKKIINKSLQAQLILELPSKYLEVLKILEIDQNLYQILIVSKVKIKPKNKLKVTVQKLMGTSCPRCWNIFENKKIEDLCQRCFFILENKN